MVLRPTTHHAKRYPDLVSRFSTIHTLVTNGQIDRRTERRRNSTCVEWAAYATERLTRPDKKEVGDYRAFTVFNNDVDIVMHSDEFCMNSRVHCLSHWWRTADRSHLYSSLPEPSCICVTAINLQPSQRPSSPASSPPYHTASLTDHFHPPLSFLHSSNVTPLRIYRSGWQAGLLGCLDVTRHGYNNNAKRYTNKKHLKNVGPIRHSEPPHAA